MTVGMGGFFDRLGMTGCRFRMTAWIGQNDGKKGDVAAMRNMVAGKH